MCGEIKYTYLSSAEALALSVFMLLTFFTFTYLNYFLFSILFNCKPFLTYQIKRFKT